MKFKVVDLGRALYDTGNFILNSKLKNENVKNIMGINNEEEKVRMFLKFLKENKSSSQP